MPETVIAYVNTLGVNQLKLITLTDRHNFIIVDI